MTRILNLLMFVMMALWLAACGGGGGSAGTPSGSANPSNFRVNAPAEAALAIGQKVSYTITGGVSPYLVNNTSPNVVGAVVVGNTLEVMPLRAGAATLSISPSGTSVAQSILVTVSSSVSPLQVQAPDAVVLRLGNSASYVLLGGVAPYRAESSAPSVLSAVAVGDRLQVSATGVGSATVNLYDSSVGAPILKTFTVVTTAAFSTTAPSTISMGVGTQRNFELSGGVAPYSVSSSNTLVADASRSGGVLTVVAGATNGTADILLRDSGGSSTTITVNVGTNVPFFTDAPAALTIQAGPARKFKLGGGTKPYSVASSNLGVVTAALSGDSGFELTAVGRGAATVLLRDSAGAPPISLAVTVEQGSAVAVSGIELTTNLASIRSAGEEAVVTALVKGASNVGVPNADITFTADTGILLAPDAQTNASGVATVRLAPGSNRANRNITVTARVGASSQTIVVAVTGTTIVVTGSSALPVGGGESPYTARALDSGGNPIAGLTLTAISEKLKNGVTPASQVTDQNGNATFKYKPTNSGTDTLLVSADSGGTVTGNTIAISISPVSFDFVDPTPAAGTQFGVNLALASRPEFRVQLKINDVATAGRTVSFTTTRGTVSAVSGAGGNYFVSLDSASAGAALVTAQVNRLAGDPGTGTVLGTVSREVNFTGVLPNAVRIQANPTSIPPNASGSTTNRAAITATVTDASANPVAGRQVMFSITADPSNGSLLNGVSTTDSSGIARTEYIAGLNSSPTNGVTIQATVPPVNGDIASLVTADNNAPNSPAARLTVAGNALFITIGFSNTVDNVPGDPSTYRKPFSVYVTDASGLAVANQNVTLSAIPTQYRKGQLAWNGTVWAFQSASAGPPAILASPVASCPSEDQFFTDGRRNNGVLDPGEDGPAAGGNPNGNGNGRLTPGNVVIASPSALTTDSAGLATFNLLYGEQSAVWVDVDLVATATVSGTESRSVLPFQLTGVSTDFDKETVAPAARVSPFGTVAPCSSPN